MTLACCVGLHVLALMLLWRHQPVARGPAGARLTSIFWLQPVPPPTQPPQPEPPRSTAARPTAGGTAARPRAQIAQPTVEPFPGDPGLSAKRAHVPASPSLNSPAPASPASEAPSAPLADAGAPHAGWPSADSPSAGSTVGGFSAGLAARQAGRIDHELRGGKSGVPLQADTPWARFGRAVEAAHIDRSMSVREDETTGPDGVIVYRFRQGNQTRCRRSGGVSIGITGASMGSINDAGWISCPSGAVWTPVD